MPLRNVRVVAQNEQITCGSLVRSRGCCRSRKATGIMTNQEALAFFGVLVETAIANASEPGIHSGLMAHSTRSRSHAGAPANSGTPASRNCGLNPEREMWLGVQSPAGTSVISSASFIARTASPMVRENVSRSISATVSTRTSSAARTGIVVPLVTDSTMTMAVLRSGVIRLESLPSGKVTPRLGGHGVYADGTRIANELFRVPFE